MKRIYELPKIGDIINDMEVINYEYTTEKNKKIHLYTLQCIKCHRIKQTVFSHGKFLAATTHDKCGTLRNKRLDKSENIYENERFHRIWLRMKNRCTNIHNPDYLSYGGRGINCNEFNLYVDFFDLMYQSYLDAVKKYKNESVVSLDRIDVNGNYCKENCRWISMYEQQKNKRKNKWFEAISPSGERYIYNNQIDCSKDIIECSRGQINRALNYNSHINSNWKFRFLTENEIKELELKDKLTDQIRFKK